MNKTYAFLSFLIAFIWSGAVFSQGGTNCSTAPDVGIGNYLVTNNCGDDWYAFTAPGDGELVVDFTGGSDNKSFRLYTGTCPSPLTSVYYSNTWSSGAYSNAASPLSMTDGEVVYIQFFNDWGCATFDFDIYFNNPLCPTPSGLGASVVDYSTADIAWTAGGSETDWIVTYGPEGFDPEISGTSVPVSGSPNLTITGLSQLSCYDVYVQALCGGGEDSYLAGPVTFCTPALCPAPVFPYVVGITNTESILGWSTGGSEVLWDAEWGETGFVIGSGTFVDNTPFTNESLTGLIADTDYDFYVRAVCDLNLGDGVDTTSLWVGPTDWTTQPNCLQPTGLGAVAGTFSASLSWTANNGETEWSIQYGAPGFALGSGTTIGFVPTNPFNLTGLTPDTDYQYYVRANCGGTLDSLSGWAGPYNFTTQVFCDAPSAIITTGVTTDGATISWDAGTGTDWTVEYGPSGFTPGTGTTETASVFPTVTLTGLEDGETYCYYVQNNCGASSDSSSVWVGPFCFTTQSLCPDPFALDVINITETAATLIFSPGGSESMWNYEWGTPGFTAGAGEEEGAEMGTSDYPYYATGLTNSTPYWYYVQAVCGVDTLSDWVGPYLFGTEIVNDQPCDAIKVTVDSPQRLFHNFEATTDAGEAAIAPGTSGDCFGSTEWCAGDGIDRSVWFYFTAPVSGAVNVSTFDESEFVTNSYTEIAVYSTGDCSVYPNFELEGANTLADDATEPPYGSELTLCGLTPGAIYYVLVNPISYIQTDITFGLEITSIDAPEAGLGLDATVCAGSTVDLFSTITGYSSTDGTWYNPTPEAGNELSSVVSFPSTPGSFDLYYVLDSGCDADTVMTTVTTVESPDAGDDGFYTACNTFDIVLSDHLGGSHDGGGTWTDNMGTDALFGGLFVPYGLAPGVYTFTYTVSNVSCPTDSALVTITLTECLGTEEMENGELSVYPNPVSDVLTIQNLNVPGNGTIEVLDVQGKVILSTPVTKTYGNVELDLSNVENGVYFVRVTTDNSTQEVRVVKQ